MTQRSWLSLGGLALALIVAPAALAQMVLPAGSAPAVAGFFDQAFREQWRRQHLGVDFMTTVGANVVSPVEGDVVTVENSRDSQESYVVIHVSDGVEHVIGHISSPLTVGAHVTAGQVVGTAMAAPTNSPLSGRGRNALVHWGVNRRGVEQSLGGDWDWDRGPESASRGRAEERGWVSP